MMLGVTLRNPDSRDNRVVSSRRPPVLDRVIPPVGAVLIPRSSKIQNKYTVKPNNLTTHKGNLCEFNKVTLSDDEAEDNYHSKFVHIPLDQILLSSEKKCKKVKGKRQQVIQD